jgi:hypothetical protein
MLAFTSCNDDKPEGVKVTKDLSLTVDAEYTYVYNQFNVLRCETTKIYDIHKTLVRTIIRIDTLPPSIVTVKDTLTYTKNDEERDTIIYHLKEYQTYIKVAKR